MDKAQSMRATTGGPPMYRPVAEALAQSQLGRRPYRALHQISCEFRAGVLVLRGRLPTYYLKQLASATVLTVDGIEQLDDQIEVTCPGEPTDEQSQDFVSGR
jgi:osmotically-inducible protein OsmY